METVRFKSYNEWNYLDCNVTDVVKDHIGHKGRKL